MSSIGHKISKHIKNNYSPKAWLKGKGVIGFYNPVMKVYRDGKKLLNGYKRGTYKRYFGGAASNSASSLNLSGGSGIYGATGSITDKM